MITEAVEVDEMDLPSDPRVILQFVLQTLQPWDSYGVYGSDFQTCELCGAGGSPSVEYRHKKECLVGHAEKLIQQWAEFESACYEFQSGEGI